MEFKTILFYAFSTILVVSALCVVTARNPVHAALFLVLSFFTSAAIWILLKAEFLAIVLVLVYVGAVMVLFLFVVMMVDIDLDNIRTGFKKSLWVAIPVGLLIVFEMTAVMLRGFWSPEMTAPAAAANIGTTKELGKLLYTQYVYAFEIAAAILLVAIIAAVALTLRRRTDARYTDPAAAMKVRREDRIRIVKMPAESERASKAKGEAK
ncbi:MAG: NADH-quinone oxidoreductase subunit J [Oxalobacter sp.]|nr:MAG: NADH-quinone oxidoreductase subunit J [Oxalobacter sp.]